MASDELSSHQCGRQLVRTLRGVRGRWFNIVMTESGRVVQDRGAARRVCRWCRRELPARSGPGRPKVFCSQRCRQWDWVARQRARELELSENELVVARAELDRLHDGLYALACAVDDTERGLSVGGKRTGLELREVLDWLLDAAKPLRDIEFSAASAPSTISS